MLPRFELLGLRVRANEHAELSVKMRLLSPCNLTCSVFLILDKQRLQGICFCQLREHVVFSCIFISHYIRSPLDNKLFYYAGFSQD